MSIYEDFVEMFDDDDEEIVQFIARPRNNKVFRDRICHFDFWNDKEFFDRFRLTKGTVKLLVEIVGEKLQSITNRNHAIQPWVKVLLALRMYASGCFIANAADCSGISKTSAWKSITEATYAIASLRPDFINFSDINSIRVAVYDIAKFPRTIGAIDCTHVRIQSPGGPEAEHFRNRKGYFSLNVQTVSGPDLKILDIVSRWPGSTHDETIFKNSTLKRRFDQGEFGNNMLVGDSGYQCRPYLMTPLLNPVSVSQNLYNESQIRTRNMVERSYGVWKRRFPILSKGIGVSNEKAQTIIVATAVLHNLACDKNEVLPEGGGFEEEENSLVAENNMGQCCERGDVVRRSLINYFSSLT